MDQVDLMTIASLCKVYLTNYADASQREWTMEIVERLHEATAPRPPDLGVKVSDGLAMREKVGG